MVVSNILITLTKIVAFGLDSGLVLKKKKTQTTKPAKSMCRAGASESHQDSKIEVVFVLPLIKASLSN